MQGYTGIVPKNFARNQAKDQGIANLSGCAGDGNFDQFTHELILL
jgi:hypothetical protein